jgi:DNA-binding MarR family transcriptional regulator
MKTRNRSTFEERRRLVMQNRAAGRELSAHGSLLYTLVAERLGLSLADLRAWDLLLLHGPVTHGKFAEMVGLTGGAVTFLIDRLERIGAVIRDSDPGDRRKVIVRPISSLREGPLMHVFHSLGAEAERVLSQYSDRDLEVSSRLMLEMSQVLHQEAVKLRASEPFEAAAYPTTLRNRRRQLVTES